MMQQAMSLFRAHRACFDSKMHLLEHQVWMMTCSTRFWQWWKGMAAEILVVPVVCSEAEEKGREDANLRWGGQQAPTTSCQHCGSAGGCHNATPALRPQEDATIPDLLDMNIPPPPTSLTASSLHHPLPPPSSTDTLLRASSPQHWACVHSKAPTVLWPPSQALCKPRGTHRAGGLRHRLPRPHGQPLLRTADLAQGEVWARLGPSNLTVSPSNDIEAFIFQPLFSRDSLRATWWTKGTFSPF